MKQNLRVVKVGTLVRFLDWNTDLTSKVLRSGRVTRRITAEATLDVYYISSESIVYTRYGSDKLLPVNGQLSLF